MKYLNTYENFSYLKLEIGEGSKEPYQIDNYLTMPGPLNTETYNYFFNTESNLRYCINIMRNINEIHFSISDVENCNIIEDIPEIFYKTVMLISFFTFTGEDEDVFYTYDDITIQNKGELYKIMATLKYVIEDYISKNNDVKYLFIGGQRGDKMNDKEQRDKLYLSYFKKNKPNWQIGKIFCSLKNEYYYIVKIK